MTYNVFSGTLNPTHFTSKVKVQGHRRQKTKKVRRSGVILWGVVIRQFYAGGKISACCLVVAAANCATKVCVCH